jgi:hypothetical protein
VLALWSALDGGDQDRERLLVAAGLVPEVILQAGGWDAYLAKVRGTFASVFDDVNQALTGVDDGPTSLQADRDLS